MEPFLLHLISLGGTFGGSAIDSFPVAQALFKNFHG
jgi:hypothetical protein